MRIQREGRNEEEGARSEERGGKRDKKKMKKLFVILNLCLNSFRLFVHVK